MSAIPHDNDVLLAELVAGSLDPGAPGVRERLEADPELMKSWQEHLRVRDALDDLARVRDEVLEEQARMPAPGDATYRDQVVQHLSAGSAHGGWWRALGGVAAALLVAFGLWSYFGAEPREEIPLGADRPALVEPADGASFDGRFQWEFSALPPGGYYRVLVDGADGRVELGPTSETEWQPSDREVNSFGQQFEWRVRVFDSSNQALGTSLPRRSSR